MGCPRQATASPVKGNMSPPEVKTREHKKGKRCFGRASSFFLASFRSCSFFLLLLLFFLFPRVRFSPAVTPILTDYERLMKFILIYLSVFFLTIPLAISIYLLPCFSVSSHSLVGNLLFLLSICLSSLAKSFPLILSLFPEFLFRISSPFRFFV